MKNRQINPAFFQQSKANQTVQQQASVNFLKKKFQQARSEGTLNLSSCQPPLQALPPEIFQLDAYLEEGEKFWEIEPLKALDFSFNQVATIPDDIVSLKDIFSIKGRNNNLSPSLPVPLFTQCTVIRHIDFCHNKLTSIPPEIVFLSDLKELLLSNNNLTTIPKEILGIQSLRVLDLSHNAITSIPSLLRPLATLTHFNLSYNKISALPTNMEFFLPAIEHFQCTHNQLTSFVNATAWITLQQLDISQNQIAMFPSLPVQAQNKMTHLILSYNRIVDIPKSFCTNCWQLTELLIHNNQLAVVPLELECLEQLKVLDISNNNLSDIPHTVGYMKSLQILKLEGNCLRTIRQALVTKPANDIKTFLRTRGTSILADRSALAEATALTKSPSKAIEEEAPHEIVGRAAPKKHMASKAKNQPTPAILATQVQQMQLEALPEGIPNMDTYQTIMLRLRDTYDNNGQLNLASLGLTTIPAGFVFHELETMSYLSVVTSIDLSQNKLTELPDCVLLDAFRYGLKREQVKVINMTSNALHQSRALMSFALQSAERGVKPVDFPTLCMDLSSNGLTGNHLQGLWTTYSMQSWTLNYNPINLLPTAINLQVHLKKLSLAYCNLTNVLSLNFQALPLLEHLDISNNKITQLPHTIAFAQSLAFLSLENNELNEIPAILGGLKKLQTLLIQGNPQRLIRYTIVSQGSAKVIEWLKNKLDPKMLESMFSGAPAAHPAVLVEEEPAYPMNTASYKASHATSRDNGNSSSMSSRYASNTLTSVKNIGDAKYTNAPASNTGSVRGRSGSGNAFGQQEYYDNGNRDTQPQQQQQQQYAFSAGAYGARQTNYSNDYPPPVPQQSGYYEPPSATNQQRYGNNGSSRGGGSAGVSRPLNEYMNDHSGGSVNRIPNAGNTYGGDNGYPSMNNNRVSSNYYEEQQAPPAYQQRYAAREDAPYETNSRYTSAASQPPYATNTVANGNIAPREQRSSTLKQLNTKRFG